MCTVNTEYHQLTGHLGPVKTAGFGVPKKSSLLVTKVRKPKSVLIAELVKVIDWRQSELELDMVPSGLTQNLGWYPHCPAHGGGLSQHPWLTAH